MCIIKNKFSGHLAVFYTNGGGLETWNKIGSLNRELAIYQGLAENNWQISFYTYDRSSLLPDIGFAAKVYSQSPYILPKKLGFMYQALLPILRYKAGKKASIIITNQAHGGWPAILAKWLWGAKAIARCGMVYGERTETLGKNGSHAKKKIRMEKWTFKHADHCIVPTKELAMWIVENYGIAIDKISVIPNYVDTKRFVPEANPQKNFDIICVGRLTFHKQHQLLLKSLAASSLNIHFIGNGKLEANLTDLAKKFLLKLTITNRVEHHELVSHFNHSKIYINLAQWEGHPKALIEAMACGCACIVAKSPGLQNLIINNKTGIIVELAPEQIRAAVNKLLENKDLRDDLGRNARDYVVKHFSLETTLEKYKKLFTKFTYRVKTNALPVKATS